MSRFKNAWRELSYLTRSVATWWIDRGNVEGAFKKAFDDTKVVSDFVGIITRFAFASAATSYFGRQWAETIHTYKNYMFGLCWITSLGLTIALGAGIARMIFAYEMRAVADSKSLVARWIFFLLGVVATLCLWFGLNDLIQAIGGTFASKK